MTDLASILVAQAGTGLVKSATKSWLVFVLCFVFSGLGVFLSILVFGARITGYQLWGLGLAVSIIMLGISYGAKYANEESRNQFTPVDLIQYLTQGFLWPATWPALADRFGIQPVAGPQALSSVVTVLERLCVWCA